MANARIYILWSIVFFFATCCVISCFFVFPIGNYCKSDVCNKVALYLMAFFGLLFLLGVCLLVLYYVSQTELYQESEKNEEPDEGAEPFG